jgi:hypothetical protein
MSKKQYQAYILCSSCKKYYKPENLATLFNINAEETFNFWYMILLLFKTTSLVCYSCLDKINKGDKK